MAIFNTEGITTGLMGYSQRRDFLGETMYYRVTQTFDFEIYSTDLSGLSPTTIQNNIYNQFTGMYSGDVHVKVFDQPAEYQFPNDSIRNSKFNVKVEVYSTPSDISSTQPELSGAYYSGMGYPFFAAYAPSFVNFQEEFSFEQSSNGHQVFNHNLSFGLITGGKPLAAQIASGIYTTDSDTTFGIVAMVNGVTIANDSQYQNYYNETYDLIRSTYAFNKRREVFPATGAQYSYDISNSLNLKEDGTYEIGERCEVKGSINFTQAETGMASLFNNAYTRCNTFYINYKEFATNNVVSVVAPLNNNPFRIGKTFNIPELTASYDVFFTTNPNFALDGYSEEQIIKLEADQRNVVNLEHTINVIGNKRNPAFVDFISRIENWTDNSPSLMASYYANSSFYNTNWPLNQIKVNAMWPYNRARATINLSYSNNPIYFVNINGTTFNFLSYTVQNNQPEDILTEYKVINRPNKLSVLNYAYQTQKGDLKLTMTAGIGRKANEFVTGFRTDVSTYLNTLYNYGVQLFMQQFSNVLTVNFTYFLDDVKYNLTSEGTLTLTLSFTYSYKKYLM